jgi:hypothetical protein
VVSALQRPDDAQVLAAATLSPFVSTRTLAVRRAEEALEQPRHVLGGDARIRCR